MYSLYNLLQGFGKSLMSYLVIAIDYVKIKLVPEAFLKKEPLDCTSVYEICPFECLSNKCAFQLQQLSLIGGIIGIFLQ